MIYISIDFDKVEKEYINGNVTYTALAEKYGVSPSFMAYYGRKNGWKEKKKEQKKLKKQKDDISRLKNSSEKLENILERLFDKAEQNGDETDMKSLKELTSALKEAVNIRRNLVLLPYVSENKDNVENENDIQIFFDDDSDGFSV